MKYINTCLGFIFINKYCHKKPTLSFKLYKNKSLLEELSTPFCLGGTFNVTKKCPHCTAKITHVWTKVGIFDTLRHWANLAVFWRTWKNTNRVIYNMLWETCISNLNNNKESVYKQIDRYKTESYKLMPYEFTQLLTCVILYFSLFI